MSRQPDGGDGRSSRDRSEIDRLKLSVDLVAVFHESGLALKKVGSNYFVTCPFHSGDEEASLSVNAEENKWNCFGCEAGGDVFSFLQQKEGLSFQQAVERARELAILFPRTALAAPRPAGDTLSAGHRTQLLERVVNLYADNLRSCRDAQQYLISRGLNASELWKGFRLGVCTGNLLAKLSDRAAVREDLAAIGILGPSGREHFADCIVVPLETEAGVVGLYGRKMDADAKVRHLYLRGPQRGVFNWNALKTSERIVLTESVLDALSLWMAGCGEVTCLYGVKGIPVDLDEMMGRFGTREVRFCLDNDESGREATVRLSRQLVERGIHCLRLELPDGQDPNQVLCEAGVPALQEILADPKPLPAEPAAADDEAGPSEREETDDGFTVRFGDVRYRVVPRPPYIGKLRVTLYVFYFDVRFVDNPDLLSHRARATSINQISSRLKLRKQLVERHFIVLLEEAERWRDAQAQSDGAMLHKSPPTMTAVERDEALAFLRRPDLIDAMLDDMEAVGYTGEERGKLLTYLIGVSRKLDQPMHGIVMSQSGAGKSAMTELVASLTPPENVQMLARLSAQAIGFLPHDFLKHKLLILEERTGGESADYSLRVMQSKQRFVSAITVKNPQTGKMQAQTFEVEGPMAYLETTTTSRSRINFENQTRCFEIHLDESEQQTQRIHERQRATRMRETARSYSVDSVQRRHHNAQRLLEPVKVYSPFLKHCKFPTRWLRTRRDHGRFLSLIDTIAFLHQYQRESGFEEVDGKKVRWIEATPADYRLAYDLAREVLGAALHELSREARELLEAALDMLGQSQERDCSFKRRDLREHTHWQDHRLREALEELVEMEYVGVVAGSQGRTYQYRLLSDSIAEPLSLSEITTPDELERLLGDEQPRTHSNDVTLRNLEKTSRND